MMTDEFDAALAKLILPVRQAASLLGVPIRTAYRYSQAEQPIPERVAEFVEAMLNEHKRVAATE